MRRDVNVFSSRKPLARDEAVAPSGYLFITAGTFQKRPFIAGDDRKSMLLESLDFNCYKWEWRILAHVLMDNHYHLVVEPPGGDASRLSHIVQSAHSYSAYHWRREDPSIRSRIWWNFWELHLADREALLSHLNYVHENPHWHGATDNPREYPFSSYARYLELDSEAVMQWENDYPSRSVNVIDQF